jgi:hypothetical protein
VDAAVGYRPVCTSAARKTGDTAAAERSCAIPRMRQGRRPQLFFREGSLPKAGTSARRALARRARSGFPDVAIVPEAGPARGLGLDPHDDTSRVTDNAAAKELTVSKELALLPRKRGEC